MTQKQQISSKVSNILETIKNSKIEIREELLTRISNIKNEVENFKIFLPLIRYFNAGKSSLLNSYLKNELLPTNILPETAVATEIYFGKEKIEAYKFGDDKPQEIINSLDLSNFDSSKYDFLKIYTSSEAIKNLPLTLVDMPGFDSNIERHNKSIFKYMEQSLSFILVIDVDDGTIKSNTINFLREIRDNRLDFFVIINKSDKKLASEVKAVQSGIKNLLINQQLLINPFVGTVSAFDDEIDDFKKVISLIDENDLIKRLFDNKLANSINSIIEDLTIRRDSIVLNADEINNKIEQILSSQQEIERELKHEKIKVSNQFSSSLLSSVLNDVEIALQNNIDSLIRAVEVSNDNLSQRINEIIRPVITSKIQNFSERVFAETIKNLDKSSSNIFEKINSSLTTTKTTASFVAPVIKFAFAKTAIGKILLAILSKVNPVLTVVTTVVTVFSMFFGESSEERNRREQRERENNIRDEFINRIIPSIPQQIKNDIETSIDQIKNEFFADLEKEFDQKIDDMRKSLDNAKQERETLKNNIQEQREKFNNLIKQVLKIN